MRIIAWNICHGGGNRVSQILTQLEAWHADVVGLTEYRGTPPSQAISCGLAEMGFVHQRATTDPGDPKLDRLLLASRYPMEAQPAFVLPELGRWIQVSFRHPLALTLILLWVPNRDPTGIKYKFHSDAVNVFSSLASSRALALGDTNSGVPSIDEQGTYFNEQERQWFDDIATAGWTDLWRAANPGVREFTWYNPARQTGFRIDQSFGTELLRECLTSVRHDWGEPPVGKYRGPSDHAAIIVDLAKSCHPEHSFAAPT